MSEADQIRWNRRYAAGDGPVISKVNRWLAAHAATIDRLATLIGEDGRVPRALDVACGAGGTVLWLARRGWHCTGVDISDEALALANMAMGAGGVADRCRLLQADLTEWRPEPAYFDLVTCFYFLDRRLWGDLRNAVRPGGLLAVETFNVRRLLTRPQATPAYLLEPGELVALVTAWGWETIAADDSSDRETAAILARRPVALGPAL